MITLKNVSKSYNGQIVLNQINLEIHEGSLTCIRGTSGIGKTTLLRLLMGLEAPDSGSIVHSNLDMLGKCSADSNLDMLAKCSADSNLDMLGKYSVDSSLDTLSKSAVFQDDLLVEQLTIIANILMPHIGKSTLKNISMSNLYKDLTTLNLFDDKDKMVSECSGGMKRRVSLLRGLYADYDILFLDEPFKGLDDNTKRATMDYVLSKTKGKTVIYVSHDHNEIAYMKPNYYIDL